MKNKCILINEMFYSMHVLTIIITCTFLAELEVQENNFGSYMRTGFMEYSQGYYNHEEEFRGLHVSMGNVETKSNGRRGRHEPITMRILQREVQRYRLDNERIMNASSIWVAKIWTSMMINKVKRVDNVVSRAVDHWFDSTIGGYITDFSIDKVESYSQEDIYFFKGPRGNVLHFLRSNIKMLLHEKNISKIQ
jgi:hypothetical protein